MDGKQTLIVAYQKHNKKIRSEDEHETVYSPDDRGHIQYDYVEGVSNC